MQNLPRRPASLVILSILIGATSLFVFLWFVLFPELVFRADHLATMVKSLVLVIFMSGLVLLGLVTGVGLWFRRAWAFRCGIVLVVCTLALDLFWIALSFSFDLFEVGPVLLLALNGIILFFFIDPAVARAITAAQKD